MSANPIMKQNDGIARDERGLSTIEYVIILVLIAAAAVGTWNLFGGMIKGKLADAHTTIRDMNGNGQNGNGQNGSGQNGGNQRTGSGNSTPQSGDSNAQAPSSPGKAAGKVDD